MLCGDVQSNIACFITMWGFVSEVSVKLSIIQDHDDVDGDALQVAFLDQFFALWPLGCDASGRWQVVSALRVY